jgi:hypothetical protein
MPLRHCTGDKQTACCVYKHLKGGGTVSLEQGNGNFITKNNNGILILLIIIISLFFLVVVVERSLKQTR